jgi:hypothetical protein
MCALKACNNVHSRIALYRSLKWTLDLVACSGDSLITPLSLVPSIALGSDAWLLDQMHWELIPYNTCMYCGHALDANEIDI